MADGHLTGQDAADLFHAAAAESLGNAKHIFTHVEWLMIGYRIRCKNQSQEFLWVTPEEIETLYSIPTAFKHFKNKL
jgi:A/G-specific adenine glycosylase